MKRGTANAERGPKRRTGWLILVVAGLVAACGEIAPQPIHFGAEECTHCRMVISDERFAAQLLTERGRALSFDAVECMAEHVAGEAVAAAEVHSLWVLDAAGAGGWVRAEDAFFLRSPQVRSPMGAGLIAYADAAAARRAQAELGGELIDWNAVLAAAAMHEHH